MIQNGSTDGALLSVTNLRTTNLTAPVADGGILPVASQEAVDLMEAFTEYLQEKQNAEEIPEPEEEIPSVQEQVQTNQQQANELFGDVRRWLEND